MPSRSVPSVPRLLLTLLLPIALAGMTLAACGSSGAAKAHATTSASAPAISPATPSAVPSPAPASASGQVILPSPPPSPPLSTAAVDGAIAHGPKTPSCVNGWVQPAPGSDFYKQAESALETSQGGIEYRLKSVRYFAGPLSTGGIGAIYYLDVIDPRLTGRVVLVSGGGTAHAAVAKEGTTGWKPGEWTAFAGQQPPAVHPPLPGVWSGPGYDAVTANPAFLSASVTGCVQGT